MKTGSTTAETLVDSNAGWYNYFGIAKQLLADIWQTLWIPPPQYGHKF